MSYSLIAAFGLVFILEGILPFAAPTLWRRLVKAMSAETDHYLRVTGLVLMLAGVIIVAIAHRFF